MTILALLFLLLTLLCCLWLCARCRCFGARGSAGSASGQEILGSDYYTIPRAKLAPRVRIFIEYLRIASTHFERIDNELKLYMTLD